MRQRTRALHMPCECHASTVLLLCCQGKSAVLPKHQVPRLGAPTHAYRAFAWGSNLLQYTADRNPRLHRARANSAAGRSEEHTSELQSPCKLVCRLLLEKKKGTRRNRE